MKILATVLDRRPDYLAMAGDDVSLLLAPVGTASVLCHLHERLPILSSSKFTVCPTFRHSPEYAARLRQTCTLVGDVTPTTKLADTFKSCDLGDWLLIADASCVPLTDVEIEPLLEAVDSNPGGAIHLVAMASNPGGTTERVQFDAEGRVTGIHRYYDRRTWNFTSGVVCSLIQVSALVTTGEPLLALEGTLADLRCELAARGVPTRDVPLSCRVLDLRVPDALLQLSQHLLLRGYPYERSEEGRSRSGVTIDQSARLVGRIVLHDGVTVGRDARIIGPAVIGAGACIAPNATVAQCLIGPAVAVPANALMLHRVVFETPGDDSATDDNFLFEDQLDAAGFVGDPIVTGERQRRSSYPIVKDVLDRTLAAIALILLSPLLLLIAVLVKLESAGGVLYRDVRETMGGRPFRCWKFRTMCADADRRQSELAMQNEVDGPQFKIEGDPRVTRLGTWLRRASLDELPQLVNVVRGEMSIVGPRPSPFRENQICIPWRDARLSVRAGITGLWQVCRADRTHGDFHQWIHYDVLYVQHMSFMVDLKILIATVLTIGGIGRVPVNRIIPVKPARPATSPLPQTDAVVCDMN